MSAPEALHESLAALADHQADAPAVIELAGTTSMGELHRRSLALATAFRRRGVQPGDRVALVMEKSADAIAVMYGALCGGSIFVPIEPSWPATRIAGALDACDARLVVSDGPADVGPTIRDRRTGETLDWQACLAEPPAPDAARRPSPDAPAFILFTSGSTGVPKGVTISHRAVGAFVDWSSQEFGLSAADRIACPSSLGFDLSTFDVFNVARSGAACVVVPRAVACVPRLLASLVREQLVTVWYSVPSTLVSMLDNGDLERGPVHSLRVILFAGEVMSPTHAARLKASHPWAELYNLYGPTETNVITYYRLPETVDPTPAIPIGRPCPYARLRLDPETTLPGEDPVRGLLLAAGTSLMSGYWQRPEETARAFVELAESEGAVCYYRTGDRVIRAPSGDWVFVGRADRQVKRRGFRMELGEIEAVLAQHPAVAEAAVVASSGEPVVVSAFVRARVGIAPAEAELRMHCARSLPSYMMPDRLVVVDVLPRSERGKTDYDALRRRT